MLVKLMMIVDYIFLLENIVNKRPVKPSTGADALSPDQWLMWNAMGYFW